MKKTEALTDELTVYFCVRCGAKIPARRFAKGSNACSASCYDAIRAERKRLRDLNRCRMCNRPASPEERASWRAWRKAIGQGKRGRPQKEKPEGKPKKQPKAAATPSEKKEGTNETTK